MDSKSLLNVLNLVNAALPSVLAAYRELRAGHPGQPSFTDEQLLELLGSEADKVVEKAQLFLAANPGTGVE